MLKEFKEFIAKGNALQMAVGIVIGSSFTAIVNSIVNDLIMPLVGIISGGVDFSRLAITVGEATFAYGNFIQAVINFLIIAFVLFIIVKAFNKLSATTESIANKVTGKTDTEEAKEEKAE